MDTVVVWVDGSADPIPNLLQTWAAARGLRLVMPHEGGRHTIPVEGAVATRVEESLHLARELLTQHDADGAERALAHAEALLRAHSELPQAAWLLAEVERGYATRFARLEPVDLARASRHWRAAAALDGGRTPGVGELGATVEPSVPFSIDVIGEAGDVRLDGELVAAGHHEAAPGLHQLVARASGEVVFAQWVGIASGSTLHIVLPTPEPCSRAELAGGLTSQVQCPSWVAVRRGDRPDTFIVQSCAAAVCGSEIIVRPLPATGEDRHVHHRGLPPWAVWTLVTAGVAVVGVAAGVIGWLAVPPTQQTIWKTTNPTQ